MRSHPCHCLFVGLGQVSPQLCLSLLIRKMGTITLSPGALRRSEGILPMRQWAHSAQCKPSVHGNVY